VDALDTAGAWLIARTRRRFAERGAEVAVTGLSGSFQPLLDTVERECCAPPVERQPGDSFLRFLERVGRGFCRAASQGVSLVGFFGQVAVEAMGTIRSPRRLRVTALLHHIEETGLNALPIVGLLSLLIGIVMAYQGADQLRRFGAEIFTVNLVGISILREIGGMMAAIIVAGRSGSSFTAQIGSMKVNQEIDALETLGLNTIEVLVLPRMVALMITLPLLTFFSNVMGLAGGAVMSYFNLGIQLPAFLHQLRPVIGGWVFWIGLIKAPAFAAIIAVVGCFEGLKVEGSAASVGRGTTQSVVESIFLVIVADAAFSILFSSLRI
jgi:phospholipid/cholesterol/gamma-HCH transport system permease protein